LQSACAHGSPKEPRTEELLDALRDLVWAGLVTNDTFQPLRGTGPVLGRNPMKRAQMIARSAGGRWSLVQGLLLPQIAPTERAYTKAVKLLERHGIVARETAAAESFPGGFAAIAP